MLPIHPPSPDYLFEGLFPWPKLPGHRPGVAAPKTQNPMYNSHLLQWQSVRKLLGPFLKAEDIKPTDNYPQAWEEQRNDLIPSPIRSQLSLDERKIQEYISNYKEYIHNMHPLIPPKDLDAMAMSFLEETGASKASSHADEPVHKRYTPKRSPDHALLLLVIALGKICGWRDRRLPYIPSQAGSPSPREYEYAATTSHQSPMHASTASPALLENRETTPGLEYFAYAINILGNHFGAYSLTIIHAHILACLYYEQLGYIIPSFRYIRFASQALLDELHP